MDTKAPQTPADTPDTPAVTTAPPTAAPAVGGQPLPPDAPSEAAAPPAPFAPGTSATDTAIQAWLDGHIAGGPIGRQTDCWNALHSALPALRDLIDKGA